MTRIVDIGLYHLRVPFRTPVRFGAVERDVLDLLLVRLLDEDGRVGWGEVPGGAGIPTPTGSTGDAALFEVLARLAAPKRPASPEDAAPGLGRTISDLGPGGAAGLLGPTFAAGIATALLDLVGQELGRPVAGVLGAAPESPPRIAVNGLVRADRSPRFDPDRVVEESAAQLRAGIRTLKLKAGEPGELEAALRAIREAFGPEIRLRVDWNGRLDPAEAAAQLRRLDWADLEYVEDPIPAAAGPDGFARLRRAAPVPIAVDEAITDPEAASLFLAAEACDVLVVKPARVGGPLVAYRIVGAATARGVPVTISTLYETGIGLAAALHVAATVPGDRAHGLATAGLLADDLLVEPFTVEAGRIALPSGAGLGVEVDEAALSRYAARPGTGRRG